MSEISDLEQALLIAAADADTRDKEALVLEQNNEANASYIFENQKPISYSERTIHVTPTSETSTETKSRKRENEDESRQPPKSRRLVDEDDSPVPHKSRGLANVVASHYNSLEEKGLDERSKSRIVYMRNFHNWIKSMLINEYLTKVKDSKKQHNAPVRVLDMCSGKGGDLLKWRKGGITHLICTDIASVSLEQCKARYEDMKNRSSRDRNSSNIYSIEYISGDSTKMRLREKYKDPSMKLDLVSCQFACHYSFESLPQAECFLRNVAECLQPGGFFIGTVPDAYDLVARAKRCKSNTYGNEVYRVSLDFDVDRPPLFGAKYNFHLDGSVDCPEFLVYFPAFVELAKKFGLKFVFREKFYDYFERMKNEGKQLLMNMKSMEPYPPPDGVNLVGTEPDDYANASEFLRSSKNGDLRIGTLSKSEWEASSLYNVFAFVKVKNTWNTDGTPIYDI